MNNLVKKAEQVLTEKELNYFRVMAGQYQVLFLKGRPGVAKSAIAKSIADKLNMTYIDLRLPTKDEVDLGVYPVIVQEKYKDENGNTLSIPVVNHGLPDWAWMTRDKSRNFMINFEELNRASQGVRDAALGILLERRVGHNFVFGDNVYMVATGNLGQEDGTTVDELDTATKGRLVTIIHDTDAVTWVQDYAKDNVHPDIVKFIEAHPHEYYPDLKENGTNDAITSGRSWDGMSKAIIANFGKDSTVDQYSAFILKMGKGYVGSRAAKFIKFMQDNKTWTLDDVIQGKVKDYTKINRDNMAEISKDLLAKGVADLNKTQFNRVVKFARSLDPDVLTGLLYDMGNKVTGKNLDIDKWSENDIAWGKEFIKEIEVIYKREKENEKA
jgi:hypothetical protein